MQYQILTTGKRWFAADTQADFYEVAVLSEKLADLLTFSRHILTSQPRVHTPVFVTVAKIQSQAR